MPDAISRQIQKPFSPGGHTGDVSRLRASAARVPDDQIKIGSAVAMEIHSRCQRFAALDAHGEVPAETLAEFWNAIADELAGLFDDVLPNA